jgi:oxygen-independent coproporphyrinogen-3 oxidase
VTPFGVYLHIPFCTRRCDYCAFATWDDRLDLIEDYVDGIVRDISRTPVPSATSVFFGGGTPSLLDPDQLGRVLAVVSRQPGAEVTVECNPETVDRAKLEGYRAAGVTRISLGVQSLVPHVLASLGRDHGPDEAHDALAAVASVFSTWNADVIYGAVGESVADWSATLEGVLGHEPPHVSAYGLTVEAGTPLADAPERHPDDDDQADKYLLADARFRDAGLASYEISNWARPGHECAHNGLYWSQGDYRGFGCAAHSHEAGRRWWNVRTPERYLGLVAADGPTEAAGEVLDESARSEEALQLALRTRRGVPARHLDAKALPGLLEPADEGNLRLTLQGRLLANEVALRLIP